MGIDGSAFARLVKEGLEAEYGGEIEAMLGGFKQQTLESPEEFTTELYKSLGTEAMPYYVTIIKYAESGRFKPEEEIEEQKEDEELESLVRKMETEPDQGADEDTQA